MSHISSWVNWLAEHTPKPTQYQFAKFGPLIGRGPKEGAKIVLKLLFLTRRRLLTKNQRPLSIRENGGN